MIAYGVLARRTGRAWTGTHLRHGRAAQVLPALADALGPYLRRHGDAASALAAAAHDLVDAAPAGYLSFPSPAPTPPRPRTAPPVTPAARAWGALHDVLYLLDDAAGQVVVSVRQSCERHAPVLAGSDYRTLTDPLESSVEGADPAAFRAGRPGTVCPWGVADERASRDGGRRHRVHRVRGCDCVCAGGAGVLRWAEVLRFHPGDDRPGRVLAAMDRDPVEDPVRLRRAAGLLGAPGAGVELYLRMRDTGAAHAAAAQAAQLTYAPARA